jgi:integrase/recombinase XerD
MPQAPVQRRQRATRPSGGAAHPPAWQSAVVLLGKRTTQFRDDCRVETPAHLTAEKIKSFELELIDAGLKPTSVTAFHRVLLTFVRFCRQEGLGADDAVLDVKGPRQALVEPEAFSQDEEGRLIAAARNERDKVLVEFMLRTGLRLSEVVRVTVDDIVESPDGAYVRVRQGKGKKDRIVPLDTGGTKLSRKLRRYIAHSRQDDSANRALFLTRRRTRGIGGDYAPLTPHGVQVLLRRIGDDAGVHANPHKFRHTFATRALSAGVDVMALQRALGHTTLAMVSRYVHYQKDDLLEAWRRRRD